MLFRSMDRIEDHLVRLGAFHQDRLVGILVYYPLLRWIMSLVVIPEFRRHGVASSLLKALPDHLPSVPDRIKITNIDRSDKAMLAFFERSGASWEIDQYEMELRI